MTIDLTFLKDFTKGETVKMKRYITLYLTAAPKTFEDMQKSIQDQDWEQLRIYAHSLKPQADFMGIKTLKTELTAIEEAVKEGDTSGILEHYNLAERIHVLSTDTLNEILKEL